MSYDAALTVRYLCPECLGKRGRYYLDRKPELCDTCRGTGRVRYADEVPPHWLTVARNLALRKIEKGKRG